jgi:hypothetical protein
MTARKLYRLSEEGQRLAQRIEARSDETPTEVQPVGREPDGKADAPNTPQV